MRVQPKKPRTAAGRQAREEAVREAANGYIVQHYPFGCLGGDPRRLVGESELWIVPIVLTRPGYGAVGEVGLVAVEARTHQVVGGTERREVAAAIKHLQESKADALEAAFLQARTV